MSRVLWWDCSVAAAGDMLLASLVDAGASLDRVRAGLATLGLSEVSLHDEEVHRGAFRARRVEVRVRGVAGDSGFRFVPMARAAAPQLRAVAHEHRPWKQIRARIEGCDLPERVRSRALRAYGRLAAAEAKLHGMPVDDVELHEVGASDAIADIVGTCLALEDLGVERIVATPLPMGTGRVHAAHGELPLPAPATLEVVLGYPVEPARWPGEWVTPTGAALVAALAESGPCPAMTPRAVGHGAGARNPATVANLVRAVVGDAESAWATETVVETVCNLDDTTGQVVAAAAQALLAGGALDAWTVSVQMKKGRPGLELHALSSLGDAGRVAELMLRQTPTLGVRQHRVERRILDRWHEAVATPFGDVRIKVGGRDGAAWHAHPEYDDVARCAETAGVSVYAVEQAAIAAWHARR